MLPDITFRTAPATHPADLLSAAPGPDPLVWLRRGDGFVGMGQAARFETTGPGRFRDAEDWWSSVLTRATIEGPSDLPGTGPLAMGAFAFADTSRAPSVLVVPQVVVARYRGREWVTTATVSGSAPHGMPDAAPRVQPEPASGPVPGMVTPQSSPSLLGQWPCPRLEEFPGPVAAADWPDVVRQAIDLIEDNGLDKVVLARSVLARAATRPVATGPAATTPVGVGVGPDGTGLDGTGDATDAGLIDPRAVLDFLVSQYRDTWTFSIDGLIGATPELLARSTRGLVTSRVLAGTIRRSGSDHANLARAAALARSSKDLEEHEFAVASVVAALEPFVDELAVPDIPSVLHLPNVMHLATEVVGELKRTRTGRLPGALTLVAALHPSAAVCGTPAARAAQVIDQLEGRDRERYSGPVGWIDANGNGEWGIALRCAQLSSDRREARLWAGGGIVAASDPLAELAETEAKLAPMRQALGLAHS